MNTSDIIAANRSFSGTDMVVTCHIKGPDGIEEVSTLGSLQTLTYSIHMERKPIRSIGNINAKDYVMGPRTIAGSLVFAVFNRHFAYEVMDNIRKRFNPSYAFLADELPPFNVTISFANEYGAQSRLVIYNIRLVNEGQVMSVNDIYTENTYQYVATDIEYLTDANGYSTSIKNNAKVQLLSTSPLGYDPVAPKLLAKMNKQNNDKQKPIKVNMVTSIMKAPTRDKSGVVKINLIPWQTRGVLKVSGNNLTTPIAIDVSDYKNQSVFLNLFAGTYTVSFIPDAQDNIYANDKIFVMALESIGIKDIAAPLIEYVTDTSISIYSQDSSHDLVAYGEVIDNNDIVFKTVTLNYRRATITALNPNTKYLIFTKNSTSESLRVYAITNPISETEYNNLKLYVYYNRMNLQALGIDGYNEIINGAKNIAVSATTYMTVSTSITKYKDQQQLLLNTLKPEFYRTYQEYLNVYNNIQASITACGYLLSMSNTMMNDINASYNMATSTVRPPFPELIDAANCTFLIEDYVEKLEFYRQLDHVAQFAIDVPKSAFFKHTSGKWAYTFKGRPGASYYVQSLIKNGNRSPKINFYYMTDKERERTSEAYNIAMSNSKNLIDYTSKRLGSAISSLGLSTENYNRLLIAESKNVPSPLFPAPSIMDIFSDKIVINVDNRDSVDKFNIEYYAVIAEIHDSLYYKFKYKAPIKENVVTFTTASGGVKPDNIYGIWIEDSNGIQVSQYTTVRTYSAITQSQESEEDRITLYNTDKLIAKLKNALSNRISLTDDILAAINNLREDPNATEKNIYDKLAVNIMSYTNRISNIDGIIRSIYEAKADVMFSIDLAFFSSKIKYNPTMNTLEIPKRSGDYMLSMYYIYAGLVDIKTSLCHRDVINTVTLDKGSAYIVIYAVSSDITTKSGVIFINANNGNVTGYKIDVGG